DTFGEGLKGFASGQDPLAEVGRPAGVALAFGGGEGFVLDEVGGGQQSSSDGVHASYVAVEEIRAVDRLAAQFGVEVEAAGGESACLEDLVEGEGQFVDRVGELIGVPAVLVVATVGVDGPEDAVGDRVGHLVVEAVAGEGGVVGFDVHPIFVDQVVALQEAVDGGAVVVVLVFGGLGWFGFDQKGPLETDLVFVFGDQGEEAGELVGLLAQVGV